MKSQKQKFVEAALNNWITEKHPSFWIYLAIAAIILVLMFITSIVLIWFWDGWWKLLLTTICLALLCKWIFTIRMGILADKFVDEVNSRRNGK